MVNIFAIEVRYLGMFYFICVLYTVKSAQIKAMIFCVKANPHFSSFG